MAKKRSKKDAGDKVDARILLGWVVRDYFFRAQPIASTLDEAWFEAEVKRRISKPPATPDRIDYFYTKVTKQGSVITDHDVPHVRRKIDGVIFRYEPSDAPDREDACPACGGKHPVIMEWKWFVSRLFMFCAKCPPPRIQVLFHVYDPAESHISTEWLNTRRIISRK